MKNNTILLSNERSEGGELISEANLIFNQNNWGMKKAVGELSLKTKNAKDLRNVTLFPDVIIFADENKLVPIMGWELKMPDVPIDDAEFISNARDKADRLGTSVFVLWNFQYASIYIRKGEEKWPSTPNVIFDNYKDILSSRKSVQKNSQIWKKQLYDVLTYLNQCLIEEKFTAVPIEFNISNYVETISNKLTPITANYLVNSGNNRLLAYMRYWVKNEKSELENIDNINTIEKIAENYAKNIIIKWINRLIFAHLLRKKNNIIHELLVKFSKHQNIHEFKKLLNDAVVTTDFYTIFHVDEYEDMLPEEVVANLNDFNLYLSNCDFSGDRNNFTSKVLENIVDISKRELMGLYTTPEGLAKYLVEITLENLEGNFADFTVGSGTIAKILMGKISDYNSVEYAHNHVWIADKYSYPLQIANLAVTTTESMNYKNIVFQHDALEIQSGNIVNVVNPSTGKNEALIIPKYNSIISNLPFISSNNRIDFSEDLIRIVELNKLDKRADLYQILILKYKELLEENSAAKIGVITSNSWFKTQKDYKSFYSVLSNNFDIEFVIISNKGKWFNNADVVASIIVLKNKTIEENNVKFIGLDKNPSSCSSEELEELIQQTIFTNHPTSLSVNEYKNNDILEYIKLGMSLEPMFDDIRWIKEISDKLICMNKVFDGSRGVRTGADKLFIMESNQVDVEYSYPMLKNLNAIDRFLISDVNNYYFHTKHSIVEMQELGANKTLEYLKSVENTPAAISRKRKKSDNWHKADQAPQYADFATSINPEKRFFWVKFEQPTVVNQRVAAFRLKEEYKNDGNLIHALLNSSVSLFLLMSSGFGRGLGVTDLTKDGINQSHFLNPNILDDSSKLKILKQWSNIQNKKIEDIFIQLQDEEWIEFNKTVLSEYGIDARLYDRIKNNISNLLLRRLSVKQRDKQF